MNKGEVRRCIKATHAAVLRVNRLGERLRQDPEQFGDEAEAREKLRRLLADVEATKDDTCTAVDDCIDIGDIELAQWVSERLNDTCELLKADIWQHIITTIDIEPSTWLLEESVNMLEYLHEYKTRQKAQTSPADGGAQSDQPTPATPTTCTAQASSPVVTTDTSTQTDGTRNICGMLRKPQSREAFERAMRKGWIRESESGYTWEYERSGKVVVAAFTYFAYRLCEIESRQYKPQPPWRRWEKLFGLRNLKNSAGQLDLDKLRRAREERPWRPDIDSLFMD